MFGRFSVYCLKIVWAVLIVSYPSATSHSFTFVNQCSAPISEGIGSMGSTASAAICQRLHNLHNVGSTFNSVLSKFRVGNHRIRSAVRFNMCDPSQKEDENTRAGSILPVKDRIALYSQISAEKTLGSLMEALKGSSRWEDEGIEALYLYANIDCLGLKKSNFFGHGAQDLGQYERFRRCVIVPPFSDLLDHNRVDTLSSLYVSEDSYVTRVSVTSKLGSVTNFRINLLRVPVGGHRRWMVDHIEFEPSGDAVEA